MPPCFAELVLSPDFRRAPSIIASETGEVWAFNQPFPWIEIESTVEVVAQGNIGEWGGRIETVETLLIR